MISKNMYKVLKEIPHAPDTTDYKELCNKNIHNKSLLLNLLEEAKIHKYIESIVGSPLNPTYLIKKFGFYLTESGQVAIEEYKSRRNSSKKATWALIISGSSFIASVVAVIVSICGVQ